MPKKYKNKQCDNFNYTFEGTYIEGSFTELVALVRIIDL